MNKSLLLLFFRDRIPWIVAYYVQTSLILSVLLLSSSFNSQVASLIQDYAGYLLLLSTLVLLVCLAWEWFQWAPFSRRLADLLNQGEWDRIPELPAGETQEQKKVHEALVRLYRHSVTEREIYRRDYKRHLDFMNLWVHQMKTPVSAIDLLVQQARSEGCQLRRIENEAEKINEGLDLVLQMARLQNFSQDYHIQEVDLVQSLRNLINRRKKQFIRHRFYPNIIAAEDSWLVLTDEKWNGFVIEQIISNALKYASQADKEGLRLTCRLEREGRTVKLTIEDQGPGISAEDMSRIFDPFFTGSNGRKFANATGIGLYLVKQVLERLEHDIQVQSVVGEGTAVTICYPAA
ncbi:HAMP domain-containing histidine kinase [Kroppenstedtia pulmonis]|uniref:histidine kinase n=1 Tax=Kroppenstedtia pulmonis TaxID=1380685 RepID=A0A7D4BPB4_9BACL|nr:sensor histidine kinase [Kroppenstedtia pulmonis]QKG83911.1 HAMP domain-containing histidine kinase [Kroppenstedtia pulmonis]